MPEETFPVITDEQRKLAAESFLEKYPNTQTFIGLAKSSEWQDDVPFPFGDLREQESLAKSMITASRVNTADSGRLVPVSPFLIGREYHEFNPYNLEKSFALEDDDYYYSGAPRGSCLTILNNRHLLLVLKSNGAVVEEPVISPSDTNFRIITGLSSGNVYAYVGTVNPQSAFRNTSYASPQIVSSSFVSSTKNRLLSIVKIKGVGNPEITVVGVRKDNGNIVTQTLDYEDFNAFAAPWHEIEFSSVTVTCDDSDFEFRAVLSPENGFEKEIFNWTPSWFVGFSTEFIGQQVPFLTDYHQIALFVDDSVSFEPLNGYFNCLKSVTLSGDATSSISVGSTIEQTNSGFVSQKVVDHITYDSNTNRTEVFYHSVDNFHPLTTANSISGFTVFSLNDPDITVKPHSIVFLQNLSKITRDINQIEEVRIVISF